MNSKIDLFKRVTILRMYAFKNKISHRIKIKYKITYKNLNYSF